MAKCTKCGTEILFHKERLNAEAHGGKCLKCSTVEIEFEEQQSILEEQIDTILLTTETATNLKIIKRIEIVTAECAFGMNIFKDLFAGVRDIVGGRSEAVQKTMRDARRTALYELKREAHLVGANAVVGVDLDYVELSSAGSMIMLVASGTAVIIEE